jgi:hypothetical protein
MVSLMRTGASILLAAFCCACSIGGNGPNSLKRRYTLRELVTSAPHIVVGTVTAIDGTRQQQVLDIDGARFVSVVVRLKVHQSMRGASVGTMEFLAYQSSASQPPSHQASAPPQGTTGIFFLADEGKGYQAFNGVYASHLAVCSGLELDRQLRTPLRESLSMRERIAKLLLYLPLVHGCADDVDARVAVAQSLVGRVITARILKGSLDGLSGEEWLNACMALSRNFYGQDICLERAKAVATGDRKQEVVSRIESNRARDAAFVRYLPSGRVFLGQYAHLDDADDVRDLLIHLMSHRDARIAESAFKLFRQGDWDH